MFDRQCNALMRAWRLTSEWCDVYVQVKMCTASIAELNCRLETLQQELDDKRNAVTCLQAKYDAEHVIIRYSRAKSHQNALLTETHCPENERILRCQKRIFTIIIIVVIPSALWHCCPGDGKGIRPVQVSHWWAVTKGFFLWRSLEVPGLRNLELPLEK